MSQFMQGGLNMFSFVKFIEETVAHVVNVQKIPRDKIIIFLDNCPAHVSYYSQQNLYN